MRKGGKKGVLLWRYSTFYLPLIREMMRNKQYKTQQEHILSRLSWVRITKMVCGS